MKQKLVILVIDDSKVIVERLISSFRELSFVEKIWTGHSYEEGEKLLEKHEFDIGVFDINLPDKSGIDFLHLIRREKYTFKNIIMMTDDPSEEKRKLCISLGADHFISKFTDFERITEIIENICN
jgi:DNA-binding NarL/FixJ family response regulator